MLRSLRSWLRLLRAGSQNPMGTNWTPEDVEDLASEFYASPAYEHSILNAHDDESLRKLVYTGLANLVRAKFAAH